MTFPFPQFATGSSAPFNPMSLNPTSYYDFSDKSTMFQDFNATTPVTATSQTIMAINDKGSGNFIMKTDWHDTVYGPTYQEPSGYGAAQFNASSLQFLSTNGGYTNPTYSLINFEWYIVADQSSYVAGTGFCTFAGTSYDSQSSDAYIGLSSGGFQVYGQYGSTTPLDITQAVGTPVPLGVYGFRCDGAGNYTLTVNNASPMTQTPSAFSSTHSGPFFLGCRNNSGTGPYNPYLTGTIRQFILFNGINLSSTNRSNLVSYLKTKNGIS